MFYFGNRWIEFLFAIGVACEFNTKDCGSDYAFSEVHMRKADEQGGGLQMALHHYLYNFKEQKNDEIKPKREKQRI